MFGSCSQKPQFVAIEGGTMGTKFVVKFVASDPGAVASDINDLLISVNQSLSTYIDSSTISRFNKDSVGVEVDDHFLNVFNCAKRLYSSSQGYFDPTVAPLVNAWGFGFKDTPSPDSSTIDSLLQLVAFDKVSLSEGWVRKTDPRIMLDFSAIAKGYGVDVVAEYLEERGIMNYWVEIGGEVRSHGKNQDEQPWLVGIERPGAEIGTFFSTYELGTGALATSGNYRNYKELDGRKVVHTINPKTGYTEVSHVLSATVYMENCMEADTWATAFMAMGLEKALDYAEKENVGCYLIYQNAEGQMDVSLSSKWRKEQTKLAL